MNTPHVLIVDDNPDNRELLGRMLGRRAIPWSIAENGVQALEVLQSQTIDLVLLDIMMPIMNGYQVLTWLKEHPDLHRIPVIVISAADDLESVVKGIQLGAEDYLSKPFNPTLLRARIDASLEKKRLRDQEQAFVHALALEQERSDRLLLNMLPARIAERLKIDPSDIAESFENVTVMFADIVGFTAMAGSHDAAEVVRWLNDVFSAFDERTQAHGLEKIKIIGDAYMVAGGLNGQPANHAQAMVELARSFQAIAQNITMLHGEPLRLRIGINTGRVVAGIIGTHKFSYDLWGDTVNIASRLETHAPPTSIHLSASTYRYLEASTQQDCQQRSDVHLRGLGTMTTFVL